MLSMENVAKIRHRWQQNTFGDMLPKENNPTDHVKRICNSEKAVVFLF